LAASAILAIVFSSSVSGFSVIFASGVAGGFGGGVGNSVGMSFYEHPARKNPTTTINDLTIFE